jgi:hypothetical protein
MSYNDFDLVISGILLIFYLIAIYKFLYTGIFYGLVKKRIPSDLEGNSAEGKRAVGWGIFYILIALVGIAFTIVFVISLVLKIIS